MCGIGITPHACADPGILVSGGGGLGSRSIFHKKKSSDNVFFSFHFSPQLILNEVQWLIKKTIHFQGSRGDPTFSRGGGVQFFSGGGIQLLVPYRNRYSLWFSRGGVQFFQGEGSNCLFPIETDIACDFPGGVRNPCPPPPPSGSAHALYIDMMLSLILTQISLRRQRVQHQIRLHRTRRFIRFCNVCLQDYILLKFGLNCKLLPNNP